MFRTAVSRRRFSALTGGLMALGLAGTTSAAQHGEMNDPARIAANGKCAVRVGHLSPDAPNVDVYIDGDEALSDVGFGAVSPYSSLSRGTHRIQIRPAGGDSSSAVFDQQVRLGAIAYTFAATGELADQNHPFAVQRYLDEVAPPVGDAGAIRLVHLAPDAPAVDVTVADSETVLYENVGYGLGTTYATVPAGDYTLEVRPHTENNDGSVVASFDVTVEAGTVNSAFAVGYLSPDEAPADEAFQLLLTTDATT